MKRFMRFRLRSLLLMMTACCLVLAGWMIHLQPFQRQHAAMQMLKRHAAKLEATAPEGPAWKAWLVSKLIDPTAYVLVTGVDLSGAEFAEEDTQHLASLVHLESLVLDRSSFTDRNIAALSGIQGLRSLSLRYCDITDQGLADLGQKPALAELRLTGADVSDQSIDLLASFTNLKSLLVRWTMLSPQGVAELQKRYADCEVYHQPRVAAVAQEGVL